VSSSVPSRSIMTAFTRSGKRCVRMF